MILSNNRTEEDRRWAPWKSRGSKWGGQQGGQGRGGGGRGVAVEGFSQVAGPSRGGHGREADLIGRGERGAGLRRELVGEEEAKLEEEVMDIISLSSYVIRRHPCVVPSFPCHPSIPMSCKSHSIILKSFKAHHINPSSSFVIHKSSRHFLSSKIIPCHPRIVLSFPCHPSIPVSFKSRSIILESFRSHHIVPS